MKLFNKNKTTKSEINLLPTTYKYDIFKHTILKISILVFLINILLLSCIYLDKKFELISLKKTYIAKNEENKKIEALNSNLLLYKKEKEKLIQELNDLKKSEEVLKSVKTKVHSTVLDIITLNGLLVDNNELTGFSYTNGVFKIDGIAKTPKDFYLFYKTLDSSKMVKSSDFNSLEKKDNALNFSVVLRMKQIDE